MRPFTDKKTVCKLLHEAILQLCKVSVGLNGNFTIDGIICIGLGESDEHEVVVKIHEKIRDWQSSGISETDTAYPIENQIAKKSLDNEHNEGKSPQDFFIKHLPEQGTQNISKACKDQSKVLGNGKQLPLIDDEVEILDISGEKQLFGEIDNFSDIECMGYEFDDLSFNDVVIKPDPCSFGKNVRALTVPPADDESSDEELKIETLKAGRIRKPHKGSYRDVNGAPVQVLSKEEFKRILKSEKLKRSRDKSPDFVSAQKVLKTSMDASALQGKRNVQPQNISLQSQVEVSKVQNQCFETNYNFSKPTASIVRNNYQSVAHQIPVEAGNNVQLSRKSGQTKPVSQTCVTQKSYHTNTSNSGVHIQNISNMLSTVNSFDIGFQNADMVSQMNTNSLQSDSQKSIPQLFQVSDSVFREPEVSIVPPVQNKGNQPKHSRNCDPVNGANIICLDACNEATKLKAHECPVCAEVFDSFRLLDLHMYRLHPGMFLCPVCGKSFKQRSTRNRHIVALHSSEKNFSCHMCNVAFTRTDTLKKHFNVHHPGVQIPKRPFSYSKGIAIQQQIHGIIQEQQNIENRNLYGEGVISPIQVTEAVESDIISTSVNVTNIMPTASNAVFAESNCVRASDAEAVTQISTHATPVATESTLRLTAHVNLVETLNDDRKNILQSVIKTSRLPIESENATVKNHTNNNLPIRPIRIEQDLQQTTRKTLEHRHNVIQGQPTVTKTYSRSNDIAPIAPIAIEQNTHQILQQSNILVQSEVKMRSESSFQKSQTLYPDSSNFDIKNDQCNENTRTKEALHFVTNSNKINNAQILQDSTTRISFSEEFTKTLDKSQVGSSSLNEKQVSKIRPSYSESKSKTCEVENLHIVSDNIICHKSSENCKPIEISDEDTNDICNVNYCKPGNFDGRII